MISHQTPKSADPCMTDAEDLYQSSSRLDARHLVLEPPFAPRTRCLCALQPRLAANVKDENCCSQGLEEKVSMTPRRAHAASGIALSACSLGPDKPAYAA